ncbi:hypothetical protein HWV62_9625 [Athelia sp. TMB]|nr:hypothetical protein HWV62_9625 [Athelia sp. TMB]
MLFSRRAVAVFVAAAATLVKAQSESGQGEKAHAHIRNFPNGATLNQEPGSKLASAPAVSTTSTPITSSLSQRLFLIATHGGVTAQAVITDRCAGCAGWGDLDMSPSLFSVFANQAVGRLYGVDWYFD